jgi:hypothetical protein
MQERQATRPVSHSTLLATFIGLASLFIGCGDDDSDSACSLWCTVVEECTETSFSDCRAACAEESSQARAISSECANAVTDQNLCLGELTCEEFEAWMSETPPESYPCKSADDVVADACF